jgi:flagellar biosynthesis/type III secretory pathway M-ring protein FliF/YscJ
MIATLEQGTHTPAAINGPNPAEQAQRQLESKLADHEAKKQQMEAEVLSSLKLPTVVTKKAEVLSKHIGEAVKKDPGAAAKILRTWLDEGRR